MAARTYVITGGVSGIGAATTELLKKEGHKVITVDLKGADVNADLSNDEGVKSMVEEVTKLSGGKVDAVIANAGLAHDVPVTFAVNYFGAVGTLEGLYPLLVKSDAPRALITSSVASTFPNQDKELLEAALNGDREKAMKLCEKLASPDTKGEAIYATSKAAVNYWMRRNAHTEKWAGKGIAINNIAPGVIATPMTEDFFETEESTKAIMELVPMPLNGAAPPESCAHTIKFLTDAANTHVTGQVVFVDGGFDAVTRGEKAW